MHEEGPDGAALSISCAPESERLAEERHRAEERAHWAHQRRHDRIVAGFSIAAAAAAAVAAVIAGWAYVQTKRQADAAWLQVQVSQDTEARQLRAYVLVSKSELRNLGDGKKTTAEVLLKNFGLTPAYKLKRNISIGFAPFPPNGIIFPDPEIGPDHSDLGPSGDVSLGPITSNSVRTESQISDISNGLWAVYVWGVITYVDAFDKLHCTKFRMFYKGDGAPIPAGSLPLTHASEGNETDNDCEDIKAR